MQNNVRTIASGHNRIRAEVVTTYQQLMHAYAIRSICFMEEHGVPARHEFDGNDYQATHMIVYAGDEPVGTLRIRWFKDFAKLERTAFREAYRNTHVLKAFADFVFDHVARKGYDKVITHAQPKYARLWRIIPRIQEGRRQGAGLLRRSPGAVHRTRQGTHPAAQCNLRKHGRCHSVPNRGLLGCAVRIRSGRIISSSIGLRISSATTNPRKHEQDRGILPNLHEAGGRDPPGDV